MNSLSVDENQFGSWLRRKLVERQMSLAQLCRAVGCDYTYLWRIIHAETARGRKYVRPSYPLTRKIGDALQAPREALAAAGFGDLPTLDEAKAQDRLAQIERDLSELRSSLGTREIQDPREWEVIRLPLLGHIQAGELHEALEHPDEYQDLPGFAGRGADFAVRVRGDSMRPTLLEGDVVMVKESASPEPGQLIAARIGDEVTLKRYDILEGVPTLVPDNAEWKPVRCGPKVRILGVVTGSYRPPEVLLRRPV